MDMVNVNIKYNCDFKNMDMVQWFKNKNYYVGN